MADDVESQLLERVDAPPLNSVGCVLMEQEEKAMKCVF